MSLSASEASTLSTILSKEEEKILACVHCGLCLEACPTYVATGDENDSPRGRIYLMRAVKEQRLAVDSTTFESHIDRCLGCRACESACPAGVEYGQLLEAARAEITTAQKKPAGVYRLLYFVLRHVWLQPQRLRAAFGLARLMRDSGFAKLLLRTGIARGISDRFEFGLALLEGSRGRRLGRGDSLSHLGEGRGEGLATNKKRNSPGFASVSPHLNPLPGGERLLQQSAPALLFKGCVTEGLFKRVNDATQRVLAVNGCKTESPDAQVCCGALHAHAGDLEGARTLARQNIKAFETSNAPIVTNAGGCGAMLAAYAHLLADDEEFVDKARSFSERVRDVGQQLEANGFRNGESIGFDRTTYDASCHLLHGQHAADASTKMLWAIPDLNFVLLQGSEVCCGGAGVYNLLEPELSEQVLDEKLRNIEQSGARVLATGNPGCHMQVAAGAKLAGIKLHVCHPVELLDESYRRAGFYE